MPSEAFRLGRTRVFFRAGQISTLQKILNETSADRAPWIFGRLQEALENRRQAKAAAEEAQVMRQMLGLVLDCMRRRLVIRFVHGTMSAARAVGTTNSVVYPSHGR